jgi:catechol 2,3-dioxygenase-like lactoylglutathione lyase family enzyme
MTEFHVEHLLVVSLWAEDVATTVHFYRDTIGLPLVPDHHHPPALVLGGGACLAIVQGKPAFAREPGGRRFPAVAFATDNLDAAVAHLEQQGVEMPWGIEAAGGERWVKFYDPAGNLIEMAQRGQAAGH